MFKLYGRPYINYDHTLIVCTRNGRLYINWDHTLIVWNGRLSINSDHTLIVCARSDNHSGMTCKLSHISYEIRPPAILLQTGFTWLPRVTCIMVLVSAYLPLWDRHGQNLYNRIRIKELCIVSLAEEKVVFSLLTDPPNYMETTVVHVLYMEVWKELETCPWRKADPGEKKRFICQYSKCFYNFWFLECEGKSRFFSPILWVRLYFWLEALFYLPLS